MDLESVNRWDEYSKAKDKMLEQTLKAPHGFWSNLIIRKRLELIALVTC